MRHWMIAGVVAMAAASPASAAPSASRQLNDTIAKATRAMAGTQNLHALKSLVLRGFHYEGDYKPEYASLPATALMVRMQAGRVGLRVVGCRPEFPGCNKEWGRIVEGWDGKRGWELNWPKQRLIRTVNKAQQALKCGAEFLPLFVDWKSRGFKAAWLGEETVLGQKMLAVRIDQAGCASQTYYFDPATYDMKMSEAEIPVHARGVLRPTLSIYSAFLNVNGVHWPSVTKSVDRNSGEVLDGVMWSSIAANTISDVKLFDAPVTHPKGITAVALEMLTAEQAKKETRAILALYDRFRATPEGRDADVADDMRWLGFEFLKVDDFANATALWEHMAAEFPRAAQFREYLGDAYVQKGDRATARAAYDQALALNPGAAGIKAKREKVAGG